MSDIMLPSDEAVTIWETTGTMTTEQENYDMRENMGESAATKKKMAISVRIYMTATLEINGVCDGLMDVDARSCPSSFSC